MILPMFYHDIPDKLLAREIAYQLINGVTKQLKDAKNAIWPNYPVQCGTFSLFDIDHTYKEVSSIHLLKLAAMPKRLYDPNDAIKNYITQLKLKPFVKEKDGFDDLFQGMENFSDIIKYASSQLIQDDFEAFQTYRNMRLEKVHLNLLTIEDDNKHTPRISLDDEVKDMSGDESGQSQRS